MTAYATTEELEQMLDQIHDALEDGVEYVMSSTVDGNGNVTHLALVARGPAAERIMDLISEDEDRRDAAEASQ